MALPHLSPPSTFSPCRLSRSLQRRLEPIRKRRSSGRDCGRCEEEPGKAAGRGKGEEGRGRQRGAASPARRRRPPSPQSWRRPLGVFDSWARAASAAAPVWHRKWGLGGGAEGVTFSPPQDYSFPFPLPPCLLPLPESVGLGGSDAALSDPLAASPRRLPFPFPSQTTQQQQTNLWRL